MKLVNNDKTYIRSMSAIKDYYRILNVKSSASAAEIKNAYRRLAMKYHPDHNINDELSAAVFAELAEAYTILSNSETRKQYNNSRYITAEQEYEKPIETIDKLIKRINRINNYIKASNAFHFNKDALLYSIKQLFPSDVSVLLNTNDVLINEFFELVCEASKPLSSHQIKQLILLLQPLYKKYASLQERLYELLHHQQKEERWEKNKIVLAVILAVILCIIIFLAAGK